MVSQTFFYGKLIDVQRIQVSGSTIVFTTPLGAAVDAVAAAALRPPALPMRCLAHFRCLFLALGVIVLLIFACSCRSCRVELIHGS